MTNTAALDEIQARYAEHVAQGGVHRRGPSAPVVLAAAGLLATVAMVCWLAVSTKFNVYVCCFGMMAMALATVGALRLVWKFSEIGILGASTLVNGVPLWQFNIPVGNNDDDVEPAGEVDVIQSLGVASLPFPKDADGYAEGIGLRDCGGKSLVCIGARDTRNAAFVGRLKPGDTTVHATGPKASAQCFLKNSSKQAGLAVDDADDKTMMFLLDGKNKKVQLTGRKAMLQFDPKGDIALVNAQGVGILIQGSKVVILGDLSLPGMTPGMALVQGAPIPQPPGPIATGQFTPVLGVSK